MIKFDKTAREWCLSFLVGTKKQKLEHIIREQKNGCSAFLVTLPHQASVLSCNQNTTVALIFILYDDRGITTDHRKGG